MILYSVNYKGDLTNYEWSIVTIHKSREGAKEAVERYESNVATNGIDNTEYKIVEIDTDSYDDCIYDCDRV